MEPRQSGAMKPASEYRSLLAIEEVKHKSEVIYISLGLMFV